MKKFFIALLLISFSNFIHSMEEEEEEPQQQHIRNLLYALQHKSDHHAIIALLTTYIQQNPPIQDIENGLKDPFAKKLVMAHPFVLPIMSKRIQEKYNQPSIKKSIFSLYKHCIKQYATSTLKESDYKQVLNFIEKFEAWFNPLRGEIISDELSKARITTINRRIKEIKEKGQDFLNDSHEKGSQS